MYGSQAHFEQSVMASTFRTEQIKNFKQNKNSKSKTLKNIFISIILVVFTTSSFAGQKQPRIAGGNGNAQGR